MFGENLNAKIDREINDAGEKEVRNIELEFSAKGIRTVGKVLQAMGTGDTCTITFKNATIIFKAKK